MCSWMDAFADLLLFSLPLEVEVLYSINGKCHVQNMQKWDIYGFEFYIISSIA